MRVRLGVVIGICIAFLSACEAPGSLDALNPFGEKIVAPNCPKVGLLKSVDRLTKFAEGGSRDITDVAFETEITGFTGDCEYIGKGGKYSEVKVSLRVAFDILLGPAAHERKFNLNYFVAIPEFHPRPEGRADFTAKVEFPPRRNRVSFTDDLIEITIPLDATRAGPDTEVLIGFAVNREQLEYNRKNERSRLRK
ncbi:MAG: hypothetical protein HQ503_08350 [Rhodospirillales bacterium]|nr:hypothetical protein [Rhodospirillales bacterium]